MTVAREWDQRRERPFERYVRYTTAVHAGYDSEALPVATQETRRSKLLMGRRLAAGRVAIGPANIGRLRREFSDTHRPGTFQSPVAGRMRVRRVT